MERLTRSELHALLDAVIELAGFDGVENFARDVLPRLQQIVPYDIAAYNEVEARQGRIATVAEPYDCLPDPLYEPFERNIAQHPILRHIRETGDNSTVMFSDFVSQRQFRQLALYQEFFRVIGIEHQIAMALPGDPALVIGITLNRARRDFSERERLLLDLLRPHLRQVYQFAAARSEIGRTIAALETALEAEDRGVVLLDRGGSRPLLSAQAQRWLARYFGRPDTRSALLPDLVVNWLRRQRARFDDDAPRPAEMLTVQRHGMCLEIRFLPAANAQALDVLLLSERPAEPPQIAALLTPREREVLRLLARGLTNAEIAVAAGVSERTVHKHLEHLYRKLGVSSRTAAAAWAFAHRSDDSGQ